IVFDCLKKALVLMMPVILIGCLASVFLNFPIPDYQEFLKTALSGHLFAALNWTYTATFGCFSLYLLLTIPIAFSQRVDSEKTPMYVMISFISFLLIVYDGVNVVTLKSFEGVYMFPTMFIAFMSCGMLYGFFKLFGKIMSKRPAVGLKMEFQTILVSIPPLLATVLLLVILRLTVGEIFHYEAIIDIITKGFIKLFDVVGYGALGSFIYVLTNGLLCMFGIHGGNVLTPVLIGFYQNTFANVAAVENGVTAGAIPFLFNSTMLDSFVFMGGAGCLLCLMLALLLNFKNAYNKRIFALGILPSIFNISEIGYLGFPVIFNPIMFIPFVFTPVVMLGITSLAMYSGLVPICAVRSTWSLPVLFSGYYTTGTWRGVALQVVLLAIGTLIYLPFVKISQRLRTNMAKQNIKELSELIKLKEQTGVSSNLKSTDKRIAD
ncbi:MAG: PTS transporter subunit EIIC, partial [Oscillospiraceae bacterium]